MACNLSSATVRKIDPKDDKKGPKFALKMWKKGVIMVLPSAHVGRVSVSRKRGFWVASLEYFLKFWQTFVMSTTSNQFEDLIFWLNLTKLLVATEDDNILDSSYFLEILGRSKCTFSSPQTFKLLSGDPKGIQLVACIVPCTMNNLIVVSKQSIS